MSVLNQLDKVRTVIHYFYTKLADRSKLNPVLLELFDLNNIAATTATITTSTTTTITNSRSDNHHQQRQLKKEEEAQGEISSNLIPKSNIIIKPEK